MTVEIPLFRIFWDEDDVARVTGTIRRGSSWANGPEIQAFESKLADYSNSGYAVAFNNGTSALHALLQAYGIGKGDEVIVPSFTFISTVNSCLFVGAKPVFAEIEPGTYGLDPDDVAARITTHTKAIMPVHYGGGPCRIRELQEIAADRGILLIEDNAESQGSRVDGKPAGTFGDSAILSFCQNKIISTGEGGAVITGSAGIYEKLLLLRSHGRCETADYFNSADRFEYVGLGYNFRIPSMNAALGSSQMDKIDRLISMRRALAEYYDAGLSKISGICIPDVPRDHYHVYQMYTVRVGDEERNDLMRHLKKMGISTKIYFDPVHLTRFYRECYGHKPGELPVTEQVSREVLSLPIYPSLTTGEIDYIVGAIDQYFGGDS